MDIDEFFSSGSDNQGNSEGRDTLSTDTDRPLEHKTKTIRKKY